MLTGQRYSFMYMWGFYRLRPREEWTLEFWARPADNSRYQHVFCTGSNHDHKVILTNRGSRNVWEVEVRSYGYTYVAYAEKATRGKQWVHVALSMSSPRGWGRWGQALLYLDGELAAHTYVWPPPRWVLGSWIGFGISYHTPGWWARYASWMGWRLRYWWYYYYAWWDLWRAHPWYNHFWPGCIDEVRFWGVRRHHRDVWYNRFRMLYAPAHIDLIAYWSLDGAGLAPYWHTHWVAGMSADQSVYACPAAILFYGSRFSKMHAPLVADQAQGWEAEYETTMLNAPPGYAIKLKGGALRLPSYSPLADEWTVEAWLKLDAKSGMWARLWQFGGAQTNASIFFTPMSCCGRGFGLWGREGVADERWHTVSTNQVWADIGEWAHVAVTLKVLDGQTQEASIYVNGKLKAQGLFPPRMRSIVAGSNWLGRSDNETEPFLRGDVDEFRVWTYARSQKGIAAAMRRSLLGTEAGLDLYLRFDAKGSRAQFDWAEARAAVAFAHGKVDWTTAVPEHLTGRLGGWLPRNDSDECAYECHGHGTCAEWRCYCDMSHTGISCEKERYRWKCGYPGHYTNVECSSETSDASDGMCVIAHIRRLDGVRQQYCREVRRSPTDCNSFRRQNVRWLQALFRRNGLAVPVDGNLWGFTERALAWVRQAIGRGPAGVLDWTGVRELLNRSGALPLQRATSGERVQALRLLLSQRGYGVSSTGPFDKQIEDTVSAAQARYQLTDHPSVIQGEVGALTWAALMSDCSYIPFASSSPTDSASGSESSQTSPPAPNEPPSSPGLPPESGDDDGAESGESGESGSEKTGSEKTPTPRGGPSFGEEGRKKMSPREWWWWREPDDAECGFKGGCKPSETPRSYSGWPPPRDKVGMLYGPNTEQHSIPV